MQAPSNPPPPSVHDRHLWQIRWVRDLVLLAVLFLILYVGYVARAITIPVLIGLALAYAVNPVVTWAHARRRVPRWLTTALIMLTLVVAIGGLMKQESRDERTGVPGASQLPLVGGLFRQTQTVTAKRELVILLKPTVIHEDGPWPDATPVK